MIRSRENVAHELDARDPLAHLRERFEVPGGRGGRELIYLCGNSLGLLPLTARREVERVMDEWGRLAVDGHFQGETPWLSYHEAMAPQTAALVGADPSEVVVMNSLTANLHLMMVSFYRPVGRRRRIAIESDAFPSDRYAVESQIRLHGLDPADALVELRPREGEATLRISDVEASIEELGDSLALILLGGVQYLTGQWFDLGRVARAGREAGAVVGFDLAHAVGNVPLALHDWDADFAVWCSYKYLNGGPGAPGGCFVHRRHAASADLPRLAGWWGNDPAVRFRMEPGFDPQPGAAGWQLSNPPILAMAALRASLDLFHEVGMPALRAKSEKLTAYLLDLLTTDSRGLAEIVTPADPSQRGCQLSLRIPAGAREMARALARRGIVCDAREPDMLRVAPVPLYNRYHEVWEFARTLRELLGQ